MKKLFILFFFLCPIGMLFGKTRDVAIRLPLDSAANNILTQVLLFPQEKIYLQTDKPYYISGEKIFFRAFLLNAFSHRPADMSRYVYVELINPLDSVVIRQQIRPENNLHYGTIILPDNLPQGNYQIRAYTRFMENIGEDYFFRQSVFIADPQTANVDTETKFEYLNEKQVGVSLRFTDAKTKEVLQLSKIALRLNREKTSYQKPDEEGWVHVKFNLAEQATQRILSVELNTDKHKFNQYLFIPYLSTDFSVSFYPEGGNLITGQSSAMAFKALNSVGNAVEIRGEVFDSQNQQITEFTTVHEGMGRFILKPEAGEKYYAVCYKGDRSIKVNLPEAKTNTYALSTVWRQNKLWITVNKPENMPGQKLYLLVHTGGMVIYSGEWDSSKEVIAIDKTDFPSGVSHLLLLTEDYQPLSERLVFALNEDWLTADIQTNKKTYRPREKVQMDIAFNDSIFGNFAVSVTDDKDIQPDTTSTILSGILLTSELRGHIPNPAYYFQKDNRQAEQAADLLMITHGWNRYDIPKAMRGEYRYLTVPNEESQSFSGIVKGGLLSKPYAKSKVTILSTNTSFFDVTETDEYGRFSFNNFEFPDSTRYVIQAMNKKGKDIVELYVDSAIYPRITNHWNFSERNEKEKADDPKFKEYVEKAELKYTYENGMNMVHLPEIEIKAKLKEQKYQSPYYQEPDNSISQEEIERSSAVNVSSLISRLPGVIYSGGMINIARVGSTSNPQRAPLIVINGMRMNSLDDMEGAIDALDMFQLSDIAQINVIKSISKLVAYGSQGYNGVIEIFTRKGDDIPNKLKFNTQRTIPLGYQSPVEFYSPQYDTPEARNNSTPDLRSTIYWKPDVLIDSVGKASVDFYTADSSSVYSIIIEGITPDGKLIYQRERAFIKVE